MKINKEKLSIRKKLLKIKRVNREKSIKETESRRKTAQ